MFSSVMNRYVRAYDNDNDESDEGQAAWFHHNRKRLYGLNVVPCTSTSFSAGCWCISPKSDPVVTSSLQLIMVSIRKHVRDNSIAVSSTSLDSCRRLNSCSCCRAVKPSGSLSNMPGYGLQTSCRRLCSERTIVGKLGGQGR